MQLKCAMLYVKDLPRMRKFYEQVLEVAPVHAESADTWALFHLGSANFALHAIPPQLASEVEISTPPNLRESNPIKLVFAVANVQIQRKRLEALGGVILQRPWQDATGEFDGVDPEGNIFQITSNP